MQQISSQYLYGLIPKLLAELKSTFFLSEQVIKLEFCCKMIANAPNEYAFRLSCIGRNTGTLPKLAYGVK